MRKSPDNNSARIHPWPEKCDSSRRAIRLFSLVWVIGFALCLAVAGRAQISPGPLARAHQSLDGGANCMKCHEVSTRTPTFRCLECHREIATQVQPEKRGYPLLPTACLGRAPPRHHLL